MLLLGLGLHGKEIFICVGFYLFLSL